MHKRIIKLLPILEQNEEHSVSNSLFGGLLIYISTLSPSERDRFIKDVEKGITSFYSLVKAENIVEIQVVNKKMNYIVGKMFKADELEESASHLYASFDEFIISNNSHSVNNPEVSAPAITTDKENVQNKTIEEDSAIPQETEEVKVINEKDNIVAFGFMEEVVNDETVTVEDDNNVVDEVENGTATPSGNNNYTVDTEGAIQDEDVFKGLFNELDEEEHVLDETEEDINSVLGDR